MSRDKWSERNELLNAFQSEIERRTHGRLSNLSLDVIDGALVVEACSATYYAVQLALSAIQAFKADFPKLPPATMSFCVNGHRLVLSNLNAGANGQAIGNSDRMNGRVSMLSGRHHDEWSPSSRVSPAVASAVT